MLALSSGVLLSIAKRAVARGAASTDDPIIAILFSALGIEAWLNELLDRISRARKEELVTPLDRLHPLIAAARLEDRTTSVLTRLQVVMTVLQGQALPLGIQPWQDLDLLVALRNFIVHQRPEQTPVDVYEDEQGTYHFVQSKLAPIAERLVARRIVPRPPEKVITPAMAFLQKPEVGSWAFAAAGAVITTVARLLPGGAWPRLAIMGIEDLVPTL